MMMVACLPLLSAAALSGSGELVLTGEIAAGNFGSCAWAQLGGRRVVAKTATVGNQRAEEYLETEADVNRILAERAPMHSTLEVHARTTAPYLGSIFDHGQQYLLWEAAGEESLAGHASRRRDLVRCATAAASSKLHEATVP